MPCTVRALYVHCTCTAKHAVCAISASGGVEEHSLFVGSSCEDESVFGLGFGTCKREFVQACACKAINPKR